MVSLHTDYRLARRDPSHTLSRRVVYGTQVRAGEYEEIIHAHPDAYTGYLSIRLAFASSSPRVVPVGDETAVERVFRLRCEEILSSVIFDGVRSTSISDALEHLADAIVMGSAVFETTWRDGDVLSISPIPLPTITRWVMQGDVRCPVQGQNMVEPHRLVRVTPIESAGPEGIGVLRPMVYLFGLWKQSLQDIGIRSGKENGGVIATQSERTDQAAAVAAQENLDAFSYGETANAILPPDYTIQQVTLPPASNKLEVIEYFDQKIRALMNDTLTSLVSSDKGSRALGDSISEDAKSSEDERLEYCVSRFGRQLFSCIAFALNYDGRLPVYTTKSGASDPVSRLQVLRDNAIITGWYDADREEARSLAGLQSIEHAGAEIDLTPQQIMLARDGDDIPDIVGIEDLIRGRKMDEENLWLDIWEIAQVLRREAIRALGEDPNDDLQHMRDPFLVACVDAIEEFAETRRRKAFAFGKRYIERYRQMMDVDPLNGTEPVFDASAFEAEAVERIAKMERQSAETIFNRVVGEVKTMAANGEILPTQITIKGLGEEAGAAGHVAEQAGRMSGVAAEGARVGLVVVGAWRVSFEDGDRCGVCTSRTSKFYDVNNLPQLPDPECEGSARRCRCGLMPVMRRVVQ